MSKILFNFDSARVEVFRDIFLSSIKYEQNVALFTSSPGLFGTVEPSEYTPLTYKKKFIFFISSFANTIIS